MRLWPRAPTGITESAQVVVHCRRHEEENENENGNRGRTAPHIQVVSEAIS